MRSILISLLLLGLHSISFSQATFSFGMGAALFSADDPIGSNSETPSTSSVTVYLEPGYAINEKARMNLAGHFALQNKFRSIIFGVDVKPKPEEPFYLGFGVGQVRYESSFLRLGAFPGQPGNNGDFFTNTELAIAPRIGFRGDVDFSATFLYIPDASRAFITLGIAYIIGAKKTEE